MVSALDRMNEGVELAPNPNPKYPYACLDCGTDSWTSGVSVEQKRKIKQGVICRKCAGIEEERYRLIVSLGIVKRI